MRMPGRLTGAGPYGAKSKTIWNDEFIATEIGQIGTQMDALGHLGCMCGMRGDKTNMLFYNGNRPVPDMWSPYGLKKLQDRERPAHFFTTDGGLVRRPGPQRTRARQRRGNRAGRSEGLPRTSGRPRTNDRTRRCGVRSHRSRIAVVHGDQNLLRRRAGHRPRMRALVLESSGSALVGADNFAVEVVPPVDPEIFHPSATSTFITMENWNPSSMKA